MAQRSMDFCEAALLLGDGQAEAAQTRSPSAVGVFGEASADTSPAAAAPTMQLEPGVRAMRGVVSARFDGTL
jgi:hypothetical protein